MLGWQAVRMTAAAADTPSPARSLDFNPPTATACTGYYPVVSTLPDCQPSHSKLKPGQRRVTKLDYKLPCPIKCSV